MADASDINHADRPHAEFGPSSFKHVAECAGYEGKDGTSAAAEKGTRIHEALEARDPSALHDEEEVEIYETICKMEAEFLDNYQGSGEKHDFDEIRLDIKLDDGESTFGTTDRFTHWPSISHAVLGDYKTGVSVIDPAHKNWQGKLYLIGAFQAHPNVQTITVVFYVPFHDGDTVSPSMSHTFHRNDLPEIIEEATVILKEAKRVRALWDIVTEEDGTVTIKGQPAIADLNPNDACRFCLHEEHCPALGGLAMHVAKKVDKSAAAFEFDPASNDPKDRAHRYQIAKILEKWAKREKESAVQDAKDGTEFPNLVLSSMGSTSTVTNPEVFMAVAESFGFNYKEVLALASFPVSKIADAIASAAPKGKKAAMAREFVDACKDAGIIETQAERFTLREKK